MMMQAMNANVPEIKIIIMLSVSMRKANESTARKIAEYRPPRERENPAKSRRIDLEYLLTKTRIEAKTKSITTNV